MQKVCTKTYTKLNNQNRILEYLVRELGILIDNNTNNLEEIDLLEDLETFYEALNSITEQYKNLEEDLYEKIYEFNNSKNENEK